MTESYLVWQRQGEEVKSVGVPLSDDLRQGLVVPHLSRQLGLVMKAHRDRGAQGYRPVGRVTSGALRRVEVGLVNEARGHGRPGLGRRGSIIHRRRVRGPVVVDGRAQNWHFCHFSTKPFHFKSNIFVSESHELDALEVERIWNRETNQIL